MAHPRLRRGLVGAALGAGLVLVWVLAFALWPGLEVDPTPPGERCATYACGVGTALRALLITVVLVTGVSVVVGWIILASIRMKPAWPIAVLGPVVGWILVQLTNSYVDSPRVLWLVVMFAIGYGVAGLLSAPRKA